MQVDDKYQYSCENKDSHVHGWISSNPRVGFWVITPSDEFRAGGPIKPDLVSHTGPVSLSVRIYFNRTSEMDSEKLNDDGYINLFRIKI